MLSRVVIARYPEIHKSHIVLRENVDLLWNLVVLQATRGPARLVHISHLTMLFKWPSLAKGLFFCHFCLLFKCNRTDYRCADKTLARPGRKQANVSVRVAWISFGALPCRKKNLMTVRGTMLLKSRASLEIASELFSFLVALRTYQHPGFITYGMFEQNL